MENQDVQNTFEKVVTAESVATLLNPPSQREPFKRGRIEFVLAFVRGENPEQVSDRLAIVAELAGQSGATVHGLVGALAVLVFGTHFPSSVASGSRASLLAALQKRLGPDIKVVHGSAEGHHGLFGGEKYLAYSFLVPEFDTALGALSGLSFGQAKEFRP